MAILLHGSSSFKAHLPKVFVFCLRGQQEVAHHITEKEKKNLCLKGVDEYNLKIVWKGKEKNNKKQKKDLKKGS